MQFTEYNAVYRVQCSLQSTMQFTEYNAVYRVQCSLQSTMQFTVSWCIEIQTHGWIATFYFTTRCGLVGGYYGDDETYGPLLPGSYDNSAPSIGTAKKLWILCIVPSTRRSSIGNFTFSQLWDLRCCLLCYEMVYRRFGGTQCISKEYFQTFKAIRNFRNTNQC